MEGKKLGIWLMALLTVFNIIQALGLELDPDEAYYWVYSRQLDWGYFDHPPVIAMLIRAGFALIPNELGVRLGAILLQAAGFFLIWEMAGRPLQRDRFVLLAALLAAMPMLQMYGFIATPDSPLLFFTILFFFTYRRFLASPGLWNTLFWGTTMALMLYSKYHGLLVILFTVFSNLSLWRNPRFYLASVWGAALFLPHLYWQYSHQFPSFSYHLVGRDDVYKLKYTTTYLLNQVLIFSPLLFPLFVQVLRRQRALDPVERAFRALIFGFWIFFFLSTFKGHAEPQWTAVLSIPLVLLSYRHALENEKFRTRLWRLSLASIALLVVARIFLLLPTPWLPDDFQDRRWIPVLQERAAGRPVIFENSYRDVSKYYFYTQERAYTFTDVKYRKNQFDIWNWEEALIGRSVLMVGKKEWDCGECERFRLVNKDFKILEVDNLAVIQKLLWGWDPTLFSVIVPGERLSLRVQLTNPYPKNLTFYQGGLRVKPVACFLQEGALVRTLPLILDQLTVPAGSAIEMGAALAIPDTLTPGVYYVGIGAALDSMPPVVNSRIGKVTVKGKK